MREPVSLAGYPIGPAPARVAGQRAASDRRPALEVAGLAKRFGRVVALCDASLLVLPGEMNALMGANGAGKSTSSRC